MALAVLLRGAHVRLTAVAPQDLPVIARWFEDAAFMRLFDAVPAAPRTVEQLTDWLGEMHKAKDGFLFGIRPEAGDEIIGYMELDGILWNQGAGWISIGIGEEARRGQGLGRESMELALAFAFDELNLHRVQLTVFDYNTAAIALYERLGFRREGAFREFLHRDGRRYDMLLYGILRPEWEARRAG